MVDEEVEGRSYESGRRRARRENKGLKEVGGKAGTTIDLGL